MHSMMKLFVFVCLISVAYGCSPNIGVDKKACNPICSGSKKCCSMNGKCINLFRFNDKYKNAGVQQTNKPHKKRHIIKKTMRKFSGGSDAKKKQEEQDKTKETMKVSPTKTVKQKSKTKRLRDSLIKPKEQQEKPAKALQPPKISDASSKGKTPTTSSQKQVTKRKHSLDSKKKPTTTTSQKKPKTTRKHSLGSQKKPTTTTSQQKPKTTRKHSLGSQKKPTTTSQQKPKTTRKHSLGSQKKPTTTTSQQKPKTTRKHSLGSQKKPTTIGKDAIKVALGGLGVNKAGVDFTTNVQNQGKNRPNVWKRDDYWQTANDIHEYIKKHYVNAWVKTEALKHKTTWQQPIYSYSVSDPKYQAKPKRRILITSLIHGSEKIGLIFLLDFFGWVLDNPTSIKDIEVVFIPVVNPDGYNRNWRKNGNLAFCQNSCNIQDGGETQKISPQFCSKAIVAKFQPADKEMCANTDFYKRDTKGYHAGVDLNRNFPTKVASCGKANEYGRGARDPVSESFTPNWNQFGDAKSKGKKSLAIPLEPETQSLMEFIKDKQFTIIENIHAGTKHGSHGCIIPMKMKSKLPTKTNNAWKSLCTICKSEKQLCGTPKDVVKFNGCGTIDEYAVQTYSHAISFSLETNPLKGRFAEYPKSFRDQMPPKKMTAVLRNQYLNVHKNLIGLSKQFKNVKKRGKNVWAWANK